MKFLLLYFTVLVASCDKQIMDDAPLVKSPLTVKYLALGDSYTVGTSIGQNKAYPVLLKQQLEANHYIDTVKLDVIAQNGWTTGNLQHAINHQKLGASYDLVTLLIGVNNQYQGKSAEVYQKEFSSLLKQAISFAAGDKSKVVVLSIPDWGVAPAADRNRKEDIVREIDLFNGINKKVALSMGVQYVNITSISRKANNNLKLIAKDGLHFSGKMHELWLSELYPVVKNVLQER
jgi:lysophospholipase L1-like esterase